MASRALAEQGVDVSYMAPYFSDLMARHAYAMAPGGQKMWVGGDWDSEEYLMDLPPRAMFAVLVGPASDAAKSWARAEIARGELNDGNEMRIFEALAAVNEGPVTPFPKTSPLAFVTKSTRTVFARGSWEDSSPWGIFLCPPRLVPDHQHVDSGNWVLSRGKDPLVVDPTPYSGTYSSLTSNAPTVDSNVVSESSRPSQQWSQLHNAADLVWSRAFSGGIVAARGDYADQFRRLDEPSDVKTALRDWRRRDRRRDRSGRDPRGEREGLLPRSDRFAANRREGRHLFGHEWRIGRARPLPVALWRKAGGASHPGRRMRRQRRQHGDLRGRALSCRRGSLSRTGSRGRFHRGRGRE
jgi:hypothetical protein